MGSAYGCKSLCSKISVLLVNAVLDEFTFLLWSIGTGPGTCTTCHLVAYFSRIPVNTLFIF